MKNLNQVLENSKNYLNEGNFKMASVEVGKGLDICKMYHRELNESINPNWDMKKQWDYKQEYKIFGKRLQYWSEKFWTLLEDNNLDLVLREEINLEPIMTMIVQGKNSNGQMETSSYNL